MASAVPWRLESGASSASPDPSSPRATTATPRRAARPSSPTGGRTFYRTGDLVFADGDGDILYCGRLDHQVKVQGFRVELAEIEHHARVASGIKQVAAVAVPDAAGNQIIHLFLEGPGDDPAGLVGRLREQLPAYMVPARISSLPALPMNANGKIDRAALARRVRP